MDNNQEDDGWGLNDQRPKVDIPVRDPRTAIIRKVPCQTERTPMELAQSIKRAFDLYSWVENEIVYLDPKPITELVSLHGVVVYRGTLAWVPRIWSPS